MKKRNKKAQAFLIASVIIITILIAFITIANYSRKTTVYDFPLIAEEINMESEKVMDYSLASGDLTKIKDFTKKISAYVGDKTKVYFIEDSSGNLEFYIWEGENKMDLSIKSIDSLEKKIIVTIENSDYYFPLTQGKHFYFIMIKEVQGEKYVYTNA